MPDLARPRAALILLDATGTPSLRLDGLDADIGPIVDALADG